MREHNQQEIQDRSSLAVWASIFIKIMSFFFPFFFTKIIYLFIGFLALDIIILLSNILPNNFKKNNNN